MGRESGLAKRTEKRNFIGCMSSVLQKFDFHHFQCFNVQRQQEPPQDLLLVDPIFINGIEAPRNSLELDERPIIAGTSSSSSFSGIKVLEEEDDVPFSIQLRPVNPSSSHEQRAPSKESTISQGSKSPNLVARLMGLELLPDHDISSTTSSPIFHRPSPKNHKFMHHHLKEKKNNKALLYESGTRSLPDTPRISLARRSDADAGRHSLQLNKENINNNSDQFSSAVLYKLASSPSNSSKAKSSSPRRNAGDQIVKQMKANFGRKFGVDLTNIKTNESGEIRERILARCLAAKNRQVDQLEVHRPRSVKPPTSHPLKPARSELHKFSTPRPQPFPVLSSAKCKKASCERFTTRKRKRSSPSPLKAIQSLQEETLARPIATYKKVHEPHGRHVACSAGPDRQYGQASMLGVRDNRTVSPEFPYVRGIGETGLPVPGPLSVWHSPSSLYSGYLRSRSDRRHADELLVAHLQFNPWYMSNRKAVTASVSNLIGDRLFDNIWANHLMSSDTNVLGGYNLGEMDPDGLEEEREMVAAEIEQEVTDLLVGEAVNCLNGPGTGPRRVWPASRWEPQ